jgi:Ca2+-binding RTX toxin-like protein
MVAAAALLSMVSVSAAQGQRHCDGVPATIVGTNGPDEIEGTAGPDVIVALSGDDRINGGGGDDVICAGIGNDVAQGQGEDDRLFGEAGDDLLDGGEGGCCNVPTNTGDDELDGGIGADILHTSDFPTLGSTLVGGPGNDQLFLWSGGEGRADNGDDFIFQFARDALLDGGNGNDEIVDGDDGGQTNETITMLGGIGHDRLSSVDATSTTSMNGGSGTDTCAGGDTTAACEA